MKVLMINGSRREKGCTYTALTIVADALKEEGIDSEIVFVGKAARKRASIRRLYLSGRQRWTAAAP